VWILSYAAPVLSKQFNWWPSPRPEHRGRTDAAWVALIIVLYAMLMGIFSQV
jgi:hypothetical protein